MARSPFQGTFSPNARPTVVTAPDALVIINGETDIIGCSSCRRRFDWNKYITAVTVDLAVEGAPGSASVNLSIPRHSVDDFYFEGTPVLTPMMEVEIYAKGYYLVEGVPQYYPIFWGMITEVSDSYSGGEHTVALHCADILKWWELSKMNVHPAFTQAAGLGGTSIFGNVFFGKNPYDVIMTLAQQSFGDVVQGTGSLTSVVKEKNQQSTFNAAFADMALYWEQRFSRIRSNLLLYGVNGIFVRGDTLYENYKAPRGKKDPPPASTAIGLADGGPDKGQNNFEPTDPSVVAFRTQFQQAGVVNFWQSEYQTKLELANAAAKAIGFEFYMDVTGDVVFKPPFYNLDVLSNKPVSWIQDIDVIDWDFSESEAEVVTQLTFQGAWGGKVDYGMPADITPFTSVTDYHLLHKYGWRSDTYTSEFMGDPNLMFYFGLDHLDRVNSKRHRATVTIPMRSELRLGFPIYIAPKDQIWYIAGISHNIAFGGRAQTTLTLTARRQKFIAPRGIGTLKMTSPPTPPAPNKAAPGKKQPTPPQQKLPFKYSGRELARAHFELKVGEAAQTPPAFNPNAEVSGNDPYAPLILRHPKTGRLVGYPNVVMVYTRPMAVPDKKVFGKGAGLKQPTKKQMEAAHSAAQQAVDEAMGKAPSLRLEEQHHTNRYQYGLNSAGVYVYAYNKEGEIGEITLLPRPNIKVSGTGVDPKDVEAMAKSQASTMIRPVSDSRGFEVIGHYRYGRGLALRDGNLIYNESDKNSPASISMQMALSGDMFASLQAQSQGLTTVTSTSPNPIASLVSLSPDDLQTGGVINPETGLPEFTKGGREENKVRDTNFVDSAPLGSPAQVGLTSSVEASQLSRALTLAEMTVAGGGISKSDACMCLLGRSDLTFINTGYTVRTLNGVAPDPASLFDPGNAGAQAPVQPSPGVASPEKVTELVDGFLYKLYAALDEPHQAYEKEIRGDAAVSDDELGKRPDVQAGDFPKSELTPPFSAPNRAALGDPAATALLAHTAADSLKKTWKDFGGNLKKKIALTYMQGEQARDQAALFRLKKELDQLLLSQNSDTTISPYLVTPETSIGLIAEGGTKTLAQRIATLQSEIARLQQDVDNRQLQLAQLSQP